MESDCILRGYPTPINSKQKWYTRSLSQGTTFFPDFQPVAFLDSFSEPDLLSQPQGSDLPPLTPTPRTLEGNRIASYLPGGATSLAIYCWGEEKVAGVAQKCERGSSPWCYFLSHLRISYTWISITYIFLHILLLYTHFDNGIGLHPRGVLAY